MSCLRNRPVFRPIRSRLTVTGLSAITCDLSRNPFSGLGSMVTRKSGASTSSEVNWQTTTEARLCGKASVCTMTPDGACHCHRPQQPSPDHRVASASNSEIDFDPFQGIALALQVEAGDLRSPPVVEPPASEGRQRRDATRADPARASA